MPVAPETITTPRLVPRRPKPSDASAVYEYGRDREVTRYKLLDMAQARWRRLDGAHLLPLVSAGIVFVDGVQQEGKASKPRARAA